MMKSWQPFQTPQKEVVLREAPLLIKSSEGDLPLRNVVLPRTFPDNSPLEFPSPFALVLGSNLWVEERRRGAKSWMKEECRHLLSSK